MADKSKIEWTEATWNPILGCDKVSAGCKNCYAIRTAHRLQHNPNPKVAKAFEGLTVIQGGQPNWMGRVNFVEERLAEPLRWREPRHIFVNSQSDLFHDGLTDEQIADVFGIMAAAHWHTFQVLTKRPQRMLKLVGDVSEAGFACEVNERWLGLMRNLGDSRPGFRWDWPLPNIWLGVSCENHATADERIPPLLQTPAAVRWISAEPLLGPINLAPYLEFAGDCPKVELDWLVVGGESGPSARPMHPDWARSLRDQCQAAGVPFFFKQWGEWAETGYSGGTFTPEQAGQLVPYTCVSSTNRKHVGETDYHAMPKVWKEGAATWRVMTHVGKRAAGRLLDGKEHSEYPEVRR